MQYTTNKRNLFLLYLELLHYKSPFSKEYHEKDASHHTCDASFRYGL